MDSVAAAAATFESQTHVWQSIYAYIDTLVLCCATDLGIADILHAQDRPLSLFSVASYISSPPPSDLSPLHRIMRFLARKGIFCKSTDTNTGEILYSLTPSSKWLTKTSKPSFASIASLQLFTFFRNSSGYYLSECVRNSGIIPFKLAHGMDLWSSLNADPRYNDVFHAAMVCTTEIALEAAMDAYKDGFAGLGSITDVGGGTGATLGEIVRRFPNIRGVNFDLPHVVAKAPKYLGVTHVGGDMFSDDISPADAIFMKSILHCFQDEDCVTILSNCRKAVTAKTGKLMIMEIIISEDAGIIGDMSMVMDIIMLAVTGGRERTEEEWKKILTLAGFPRCKVIRTPSIYSIIEAYLE